MNRLTLAWFLFVLIAAAIYYKWATDYDYDCTGPGWTIRTTENEISRDSLLILGILPDGRQVAMPRASVQKCSRVAK
jgi:hypothetical protein